MIGKDTDPLLERLEDDLAGWSKPEERLRYALAHDELTLFCQPIAALYGDVRFPMAEVLVRLREEENALLPPGQFLPLFEHYHLMTELDRWVVRKTVSHVARGSRIPRFSINLSSQSVEDATFAMAVALDLVREHVPGTSLLFEISEEDTLNRLDAAVRLSGAIRTVGCGIVVSGFGKRTASFAPLKALRPDYVKVDGVIVRRLLTLPAAEAKLRAVLRVGEVMGYQVIAEMVEDQDILVRLKALGVGFAQGFGIQQPHTMEMLAR